MTASSSIAFLASAHHPEAEQAVARLKRRYRHVSPEEASTLVVLGGDGFLLRVLHEYLGEDKKFFGMNLGRLGFLLNTYGEENLQNRLSCASVHRLRPLSAKFCDAQKKCRTVYAFNEVCLFRKTVQTAHMSISIDGKRRLKNLIGDGFLVSTPAGSTAYNFSAGGPIVPLGSGVLALTPIAPFHPRNMRPVLLPETVSVEVDVLNPAKRPIVLSTDQKEWGGVTTVHITLAEHVACVLTDSGRGLTERMVRLQFPPDDF